MFGPEPADERLVKCGFCDGGKVLTIVQGPLSGGKVTSIKAPVTADAASEFTTSVLVGFTSDERWVIVAPAATLAERTVSPVPNDDLILATPTFALYWTSRLL